MRYSPYDRLDGRPNIIVDGSPTAGTVLTLSHWPGSPVPAGLERDLSAQIAFAYLDRPDVHVDAELVSNNHLDQDGLVSVYALVEPADARRREAQLVDVAAAGDFGTYRDRTAARVSMAIAAMEDRGYEELLRRLPELCDHVERYREQWEAEDATLEASEALVRAGAVTIEEVPDLDLAVVTVPDGAPDAGGHRFGGYWALGLHPMAVHNATSCCTLLTVRGASYEVTYRYESWVQYRSRRPRPRVDLAPLAAALTADERSGGTWTFEGVGSLTPRLYLDGAGESTIDAATFRARVEAALGDGPPAWDPYPGADTVT